VTIGYDDGCASELLNLADSEVPSDKRPDHGIADAGEECDS
jgi:hypothetical protein